MGHDAVVTRLSEYLDAKAKAGGISRTAAMETRARDAGVSSATIRNLLRGMRLRQYDKIKRLSQITGIPEVDLAWIP